MNAAMSAELAGVRVVRFRNHELDENIRAVVDAIRAGD
jgi:very-short-patch-repair endonuclease